MTYYLQYLEYSAIAVATEFITQTTELGKEGIATPVLVGGCFEKVRCFIITFEFALTGNRQVFKVSEFAADQHIWDVTLLEIKPEVLAERTVALADLLKITEIQRNLPQVSLEHLRNVLKRLEIRQYIVDL